MHKEFEDYLEKIYKGIDRTALDYYLPSTFDAWLDRLPTDDLIDLADDYRKEKSLIDGNKLNNQKSNLRICTNKQNSQNRLKQKNASYRFEGITYIKNRQVWVAKIRINGKLIQIGEFKKDHWAAMSYDIWAKEIQGEYAKTNFKSIN